MDSIKFDGRNIDDIEDFLYDTGVMVHKDSNGKIVLITNSDEITLFKDDVISFEKDGLHIYKPSYVIK